MANPGGYYPGRQISIGRLITGEPAFVYFVSGRSPSSQQRYAAPYNPAERSIRIKPVDANEKFDPFRHYQCVVVDPDTGLVVISNSEAPVVAVFEVYKFKEMRSKNPKHTFEGILSAIGPEYDNKEKPTPRVIGVVDPEKSVLGITDEISNAYSMEPSPSPGKFEFVQTYDGNFDYRSFDPGILIGGLSEFWVDAANAQELTNQLYDISDYTHPERGELRVCSVAGVRNGNGPGGWELARRNRHKVG